MRPARVLLALVAATALLSCQVVRNAIGSDAPVAGVWGLLPAESAIWFIGIKNDAVAVPGSFGGIEGRFDVAKREASVEVSVGSLRTGDPGRDENLRVHFFDAIGFPTARFAMTGAPGAEELPAVGEELSTTLAGTLLIHGSEFPLSVPVRITRTTRDRIRVRNTVPVVLSVKDLGLDGALAVLKAVCGHEAVSGAVPIEIDIAQLFRPSSCHRVQKLIEDRLGLVEARMKELRQVRPLLRRSFEQCQAHEKTGRCEVVAKLSARAERP